MEAIKKTKGKKSKAKINEALIKIKDVKVPANLTVNGYGVPIKVSAKVYDLVCTHLWGTLEAELNEEELVQLGEIIFRDKYGYAVNVLTEGKNSTRIARFL